MFISTQCRVLGFFVISSFLVACGGGTSSGSSCSGSGCAPDPVALQAGVVKGPLTGPRTFTLTDGEGTVLASGPVSLNDTMANPDDEFLFDLDASAALSVETPTPLLLEVNASGATDATTSATPIVTEFKTLISRDMLLTGDPVVLSPLGTLATDLLLGDELPDGETFASVTDSLRDAIERAMNQASSQVIAAFGFGVAGGANVFSTPTAYAEPADGSVIPANELQNIIGLRKANEAFALALQAGADGDAAVPDADAMLANVVTAFSLDTSTSPATRIISRTEDAAIDGIQEFLDAADAITDVTEIVPGTSIGDIEQLLFAAEETTDLGQMPSTTQTTLFNQLGTIGLSLPAIDAGFEVPGTDLANDSDGDGDPDSSDPFDNDPTADSNNVSEIVDTNKDGILNIGDAPSAADDTDGDGVPDLIDNCAGDPEDNFGGEDGLVNASQVDSDGDGLGDSCDSTPDEPFGLVTLTDVDGDDVDDVGGPGLTGPDNCPTVENPEQFNLDRAIFDGDLEAIIVAVAAFTGSSPLDPSVPEELARLNDEYLAFSDDGDGLVADLNGNGVVDVPGDEVTPDDRGDACDADADGDGRFNASVAEEFQDQIPDEPETRTEEADGNPDPDALSFSEDSDGDGIENPDSPTLALGEIVDNCPNTENLDQANNDAADEALALGIDIADLGVVTTSVVDAIDAGSPPVSSFYGVGDACDIDDDNDGINDDDEPGAVLDSSLPFFFDRLTFELRDSSDSSGLAGFAVIGESDINTSSGVLAVPNHELQLSLGAGVDSSGDLFSDGAAGNNSRSLEFIRPTQRLTGAIDFSGALCPDPACTLSGAAGSAVVTNGGDEASSAVERPASFDVPNFDMDSQLVVDFGQDSLAADAALDTISFTSSTGAATMRRFGASFVGTDQIDVVTYDLNDACEIALFGAGIDETQQAADDAIDAISDFGAVAVALASVDCTEVDAQLLTNFRVLADQDESGAQSNIGNDANAYGVVGIDLSFSSAVGNSLTSVATKVGNGDGSNMEMFEASLGVDTQTVEYSEPSVVRSLTPDVNGVVELGDLKGFADAQGSLLTLSGFSQGSGGASDVVQRAYAARVEAVDATSLVGDTYSLEGLYVASDSEDDRLNVETIKGLSISFKDVSGDVVANITGSLSGTQAANYREDENLMPQTGAGQLSLTTAEDSNPVVVTNGRIEPITFPGDDQRVPGLEIDGFVSSGGLVLRLVNTFAEPAPPSGGGPQIVVLSNVILVGWTDTNANGYPDASEMTTDVDAWGLGTTPPDVGGATPANGTVISRLIGSTFVTGVYFDKPNDPETMETEDYLPQGDAMFFGDTGSQDTEGGGGGGPETPDIGFTGVARSNPDSPIGLTELNTPPPVGELYQDLVIGQGVVFGFPVTP